MATLMPVFSQEVSAEDDTATNTTAESSDTTEKSKNELIDTNTMLSTHTRGIGYGLTISGAIVASLGAVLEIATLTAFFSLSEDDRVQYTTNFGLFSMLHITSSGLITSGTTTFLAGATYVDDSVYAREYWKNTQVAIGSTLLSVGAASSITGGVLLALASTSTNIDMQAAGYSMTTGGIPLVLAGLANLFIGLFAK